MKTSLDLIALLVLNGRRKKLGSTADGALDVLDDEEFRSTLRSALNGQFQRSAMNNAEPWYGVRLVYRWKMTSGQAYEERVLLVHADSAEAAIAEAERLSKDYESADIEYLGYAIAFNIYCDNGQELGPGTEVFSLVRESELPPDQYIDRFHDTGNECSRNVNDK